ncbi:ParA family partition ATPase [Chondromyces apiculatus]|uniref:Chromosome (Plasmid) partitioning protein ParA n=1 Tax=Chondromyces apiculatus DSM 436 TaxID=1192034 RepID=A0A017T6A0_9BACT|nr:ParA family partition ATPase [Chondromyces apiculatus]EYF04081.1 Chromosome (plasmid) partitioning protein ParA [Chondromyces apiculatus DSM 436]
MIVALTGQKGGIGKSTTAVSLAVAAMERGRRVLLVDADPQGTVRTWGEVACEAEHPMPTIVAMGAAMHRPGQLGEVAGRYDLTLIDCPPRQGEVARSALMVADVAVFPCGPTAADAWALSAAVEVFEEARALREALQGCVLITRKQGRTALGKGARAVLETTGLPVLKTELGYRVAYQEALAMGQGVTSYAPRDAAAREIVQLFDELEMLCHGQEARRGIVAEAAVA